MNSCSMQLLRLRRTTAETSELILSNVRMFRQKGEYEPESMTLSYDTDATGGYFGLQDFARIGMSDDDFAKLVVSNKFPSAIESTRSLPVEHRRWLLDDALPAIVCAFGFEPFDEQDPAVPHRGTFHLPDLN